MRRVATFLALLVTLPVPALAGPSAREAAPARVELASCPAPDERGQRTVAFEGSMRSVPGAKRMLMRFTLLEREGRGRWQRVALPALDTWRRSRAGVRRFVYRQQVAGLEPGPEYRSVVDFRWVDRDGDIVRSARRRSRPCAPVADLPDLEVRSLAPAPGTEDASTSSYAMIVHNSGTAPATGVRVVLSVDGRVAADARLAALAPGESRAVELRGPACQRVATAIVDPDDTVREQDERDNVRLLSCG